MCLERDKNVFTLIYALMILLVMNINIKITSVLLENLAGGQLDKSRAFFKSATIEI